MVIRLFKALSVSLLLATSAPIFAAPASTPDDQIRHGEYLAHLGDCVACHTAPGGKPMAGGLEMHTPFGIIHSTNITPDPTTGIAHYTFEQFDRALRTGVADDGQNLYPAMPYPSFAKIAPDDMQALYAYFMHGVTPVYRPNQANSMRFPFNIRIGLAGWDMLFGNNKAYRYNTSQSPQWNRGAYIVEGLGHCGSCHTPRGLAFEEKAMSEAGDNGKHFLAGADVESWLAVDLRQLWTAPEFARFLQTGQNEHATAFGSMTDVIHNSSQYFTPGDLAAIGEYIQSLSPSHEEAANRHNPVESEQASNDDLYHTRGGLGYVQFCSTCHQTDGRGVNKFFPPLAGNTSLQTKDPTSFIHVLLTGSKSAQTQFTPRAFGMPTYASLSDQELAEIMSFVRSRWGNQGAAVTAGQVHKLREELALSPIPASNFVVPRYAAMLSSPNAAQLIYGMQLMQDTKVMLPHNVGDGLTCNSCHLNGGTVAKAAPYAGLAAIFPAYAARAGKVIDFADRINGCLRRSMNGTVLTKDSTQMQAILAYMDWMRGDAKKGEKLPGRGLVKIDPKLVPNAIHGKVVYKNSCAACHGDNGEGIKRADGTFLFPPLWGEESYNIGAGIAKTSTAAGFVKTNMPMANTQNYPIGAGGMSDQDALDVAEYFTHMPRPDFPDKVHDWPNGGKPKDSRY